MNYRNGIEVLPPSLLKELQRYIQGELIYIPKLEKRAGWGELSGARKMIARRNAEIYQQYESGMTAADIGLAFHLSPGSIRKIVAKFGGKRGKHDSLTSMSGN